MINCLVIMDIDGDITPREMELTEAQVIELDRRSDVYSIIKVQEGKIRVHSHQFPGTWGFPIRNNINELGPDFMAEEDENAL